MPNDFTATRTIWKFALAMADRQVVGVPKGARFLCVQVQAGTTCLWAEVDRGAPLEQRTVYVYGTGHPLDHDDAAYVGTVQIGGGAFVFHVYVGGADA